MCDVDDTIVMHEDPIGIPFKERISVVDPLGGAEIRVRLNNPMIRLVKEEFARGSYIIVWSRGGFQWASNVIDALGLKEHVHQIMSKPEAYFDDKPVESWLTQRVYLKPETIYKAKN